MPMSKSKLEELLAKARKTASKLEPVQETTVQKEVTTAFAPKPQATVTITKPVQKQDWTWNTRQQEAINLAMTGASFCLIGAAGTGKTTVVRQIASQLVSSGMCGVMREATKYLQQGAPGIAFVSFTRRAVQNLKKVLPLDLKDNAITIHKLLEYAPHFYTVLDETTYEEKNTMRFEPSRTASNPILDLRYVFVDESSMVSTELFSELQSACPRATFIFLGDLNQLPPVYGSAILGYKLLEVPVVELTEVYRQALESPIIRLAHAVLAGKPLTIDEAKQFEEPNKLKIHNLKKRVSGDNALIVTKKFFTQLIDSGEYNPDEDIILCPFNKSFGTIELNKAVAQRLGELRQAEVYEIIAGYNKYYFSVGDRVLHEKQDAVITAINKNGMYIGKNTRKPSRNINRWGFSISNEKVEMEVTESGDIDKFLEMISGDSEDKEERKKEASHCITVKYLDTGSEVVLSKASEINELLFAYALTIHKAQGSEWRKVFLIMHNSHNTMLQRELLYTGITRAREYLYVICDNDCFEKGISSQKIKGNTLAEKAEYFKGKQDEQQRKLELEQEDYTGNIDDLGGND